MLGKDLGRKEGKEGKGRKPKNLGRKGRQGRRISTYGITLLYQVSYRAANLNTASLLGSLGRFLSVFRNFTFFGL